MDKTLHQTQNDILKDLLFTPQASYTSLQKNSGHDSDYFKFHITKLVDLGYVDKIQKGLYCLSVTGKEYANKLDTDVGTVERQPKAAVIIVAQNGDKFLLQERLKHPYFGFWGYPGGKIRWGETIMAAAARELMEETGLCATLSYKGVYHEIVKHEDTGEIVEDKIFHVVYATNTTGALLVDFEGGNNAWLTQVELLSKEKRYKSCDIETEVGTGTTRFIESEQIYGNQEF